MHHEDIKAAIRKKGVTPAELAAHLHVSAQTVSSVIRGATKSRAVAAAISKVTGLPLDTLWPGAYGSRPAASKRVEALLGRSVKRTQAA